MKIVKRGRRIRQNGLAHSPKWTSACMIHHTCVYIRAGWRLLRLGTPLGRGTPGAHAAKASSPLEYIHMYNVSCMRWSILANAPIHFGECAYPFYRMRQSILANVSRYSGIQVFTGYPGYPVENRVYLRTRSDCMIFFRPDSHLGVDSA